MINRITIDSIKNKYKDHFIKYKNKYIYLVIFIFLLSIIIFSLVNVCNNKTNDSLYLDSKDSKDSKVSNLESFKDDIASNDDKKNSVMVMKRPFLNIKDNNGNMINVVFITHPFSRKDCKENYDLGKKEGIQYIGISSYCDFPAIISNPHDAMHDPKHMAWTYNYFDLCKGWCHCFRNPIDYGIPYNYPHILLSESDFAKYKIHKPDDSVKKEYDFIYVCLKDNDKCDDGWQSYNRNWEDSEKYLDIMCNKFHLKGLLIGRINCKIPTSCHHLMETTDFLEYHKFIKMYNKCRFAFVPNKLDASPRVMTEAICFNLPILCNYNITGGWKYITPEVGEYFNKSINDFESSLSRFLKNFHMYKPREYYMREYNEEKKGKELLDFILKCVDKDKLNLDLNKIQYLVPCI